MGWEWIIALDMLSLYMVMLACCVIYIVYHIAHTHGAMVFAKALLCLGRCLMATQHALWLVSPFCVALFLSSVLSSRLLAVVVSLIPGCNDNQISGRQSSRGKAVCDINGRR